MSRIGNYALDIQEQANELGYSTIQEAIDDGCAVVDNALIKVDSRDVLDEMREAHEAWLRKKEELLIELSMLADNLPDGGNAQRAIERAIEFIKEVRSE